MRRARIPRAVEAVSRKSGELPPLEEELQLTPPAQICDGHSASARAPVMGLGTRTALTHHQQPPAAPKSQPVPPTAARPTSSPANLKPRIGGTVML